jgi:serine/threonine protein kinase
MSPQELIAHYRILSKLGQGGMGAVYRATDTKLNRDVAIKILPPAFAADPDRLARFTREAQVLASLNHPNIADIYGIEQNAIVMELVEGDDLKGPVPVDTALAIARQIAAGLEAAHEKGIIHRDLKPANIKITPDGAVKLLDFGLAKATEQSAAASSASPTLSPTLSLAMTQAGMILGTAAYMAPEQARGKIVDRRADIWAFGVVLFELLTGRMLFAAGDTVTDIIAAVVTRDPDWNLLPPDTPPHVRRLLDRCLRKDPKLRLQAIGDARILLDDPDPVPSPAPAHRASMPWALAGLALAVALMAGVLWLRARPTDTPTESVRFSLHLPEDTQDSSARAAPQAVPSPDGRIIAFIARDREDRSSLWLRPLGSLTAQRLEKTEGANYPFWSPDGKFVAFFAADKLKKIPVSGGVPQTLCEISKPTTAPNAGNGGSWSSDGVIVFSPQAASPLLRVSAAGGLATPVTSLEPGGELWHAWPQFLPDGHHLLYFASAQDPAKSGIYVQELGSSQRVLVLPTPLRAAWAPPGYLLFVREQTLFAQRLDPKTFQLTGEPHPVAQDINTNEVNGRAAFAVSATGVLSYQQIFTMTRQLAWLDRAGKVLGAIGQPARYWSLALSPDERSAAVLTGSFDKLDLWIMDLTSGVMTRATSDERANPVLGPWSPDSRRVAVNTQSGIIQELEVASGKTNPLNTTPLVAEDWSPDGGGLLCIESRLGHLLSLLPLPGGAKPQSILDTPSRKGDARLSPDGKFVAYISDESGTSELYIASFPSFSQKRQISSGGARYPRWRRDGKELFFRRLNTTMSAAVRLGSSIDTEVPKGLFQHGNSVTGVNSFSVSADGKRFLVMNPTEKGTPAPEFTVVLNWAAELKP